MNQSGDGQTIEIRELIGTFLDAVLALKPVAERAHLSWRDEDTHDDWQRLVASAFDAFVRSPIFLDPAQRGAFPLARYDFNVPTYASLSWIEVAPIDGERPLALVRFEAGDGDFRSMWLEDPRDDDGKRRQGKNRLWTPDVRFRLARRDKRSVTLHDAVAPAE